MQCFVGQFGKKVLRAACRANPAFHQVGSSFLSEVFIMAQKVKLVLFGPFYISMAIATSSWNALRSSGTSAQCAAVSLQRVGKVKDVGRSSQSYQGCARRFPCLKVFLGQ